VLPARPGHEALFHPMPDDVLDELNRFIAAEDKPGQFRRDGQTFTHLLASRRMRDMFNSNGRYVRTVRQRTPHNPAYLNPEDLAALGIAEGDTVEISSSSGRAIAIAGADPHIKRGVVSMAHGWGALPGSNEDPSVTGTAVNALIDTDKHYESVNAMPHMSGIPVNIAPVRR